ncbi:hypothetical protein GWN49_01695 [Candidatus Bathyarchaeota archaeon]|nr:hypothetical protein [Candidatus Bathyarchaeota archaeon]
MKSRNLNKKLLGLGSGPGLSAKARYKPSIFGGNYCDFLLCGFGSISTPCIVRWGVKF